MYHAHIFWCQKPIFYQWLSLKAVIKVIYFLLLYFVLFNDEHIVMDKIHFIL